MKLNLQQKVAIVLSLLWASTPLILSVTFIVEGTLQAFKFSLSMLVMGILPPLFILWISGALGPIISWFKQDESVQKLQHDESAPTMKENHKEVDGKNER